MIYKLTKKKADSDETEEVTEENRLAKPISINGVTAPWVVEITYVNGAQVERHQLRISIEYNAQLPDSLFAKPASIKGLK